MKTKLVLSVLCSSALCQYSYANEPVQNVPNILCIAFEDMSPFLWECYGQKQVHTPNMNLLASKGIQYMNAWSTAPQSSPARSSLITGCYATTFGMDVHPVSNPTPQNILSPQLMREAGYYCTNNSKTHYNTTIDNKSCWDECFRGATYNSPNRKKGQPFFAVFNSEASHMGRMRTFHTEGRRNYLKEGIDTASLVIPPYIPDLPEVKSDFAAHLEAAQDIDQWIGVFLKDLKEKKLDENTIIFVYSDHGGCLPRGKGYLYETGLKVPFIVYFPDKWKHLAQTAIPTKSNELVGFVDFAPTFLSLADIKIPEYMQGKAFLGKQKQPSRKIQYGFTTNQLHHYRPVRVATDGRFKYIRNYIPYRRTSLRNYYQWGMPSNIAWDTYIFNNLNSNTAWNQPFEILPTEQLFDLENDPWELHNLSHKQEYEDILKDMRANVSKHIRETVDLGFLIPSLRKKEVMYHMVREQNYPIDELYQIVELAGTSESNNIPYLTELLKSKYIEFKYWAIVGLSNLALKGQLASAPKELKTLLSHNDPYIRSEAAYACYYSNLKDEAISTLLDESRPEEMKMQFSVLECLSKNKCNHDYLLKYKNKIKTIANKYPSKANEDIGLIAKGILADLQLIKVSEIYSDFYELGLKLNKGRRINRAQP